MKSRKVYSINELLLNESFVQWVKHGMAASDNDWNDYLRRNPAQENNVKLASHLIKAVRLEKEYLLDQEAMNQLRAGIRYKQLHKSTPVKARNRFIYWGVAASLLLLMAFYFGFNQWTNRPETSRISHNSSLIEKRTTYGQKLTVSLPDGTLVKLNSGSSIAYPEEFSNDRREVRFSGEGFFEVEKDPERPFIVESDGVFTKVLGTSFNLRSYSNEGKINVAVVTGKVEIRQLADTSVLLLPEEMGVFDKSKRQITKQLYDTAEVLVWRDGILNFNKTPLPKVLDELEKWYGVKFVIDEDVRLAGDFSGRFQNANLENVLEGIRYTSTSRFQFSIEDKKVYLKTE